MKKEIIKELYYGISIALIIFIIFLGFYFYFLFNSEINTLSETINNLKNSFDEKDLSSLILSLSNISYLFLAQLITFIILTISLIIITTYLFRLYSIQKRDSLIDPLTRIYNRKTILSGLKKEIKRAERFNHPLSIAILDIDYFKQYNDKNGHLEGDEALKKFALVLEKTSRELDMVGRIGGEEFLIVFPETTKKDAKNVCERIRSNVEKTKFKGEQKLPNKNLTTSIGISSLKLGEKISNSSKIKNLISEADKNLYIIKESTRNSIK